LTYIGIDPSLRGTGIAIVTDARVVELHHLRTAGMSRAEALSHIARETQYIVRQHRGALVVIEGYAYGYHASRGYTPVVEVGGAIRAIVGLVAKWVEVPPSQWQRWAMGRFQSTKNDEPTKYLSIAARVTGCDHLLLASIDEADAAMIACYAAQKKLSCL